MTNPSASAVLKTVLASLDAALLPGLKANLERATPDSVSEHKLNLSTALTMGHLLRHVLLRIEGEDAQLRAEGELLRDVIAKARDFLAEHQDAAASSLIARLDERNHGDQMSLKEATIATDVGQLRLSMQAVLKWLQERRNTLGKHAMYLELRNDIRRCIACQIENEAVLIDAAMAGRGFRR